MFYAPSSPPLAQVLSKCKPEVVANVHKQLQSVTEECYAYDVNFICTAFKWPAPMNKVGGARGAVGLAADAALLAGFADGGAVTQAHRKLACPAGSLL